ncbi:L,D-transpeptidase family protein [uncultured Selenomonas sp.]|uniref:L,D-transpeptidase family protein n=1 Tax=uncultured Selenomonas sp. TaxID=159275 RepID=UPI0025E85E6B|nr:L,D-transpeptidase family protein [uncultured Selenomonas sp.]
MSKKQLTAALLSAAILTTSIPAFAAEAVTTQTGAVTTTQAATNTTATTNAEAQATTSTPVTTETQTAQPAKTETTTTTIETTATSAKTETKAPVDEEALLDSRKISINLAARSLAVYEGSNRIRLYPIGPGKESTPTPVGYFKVESKDLNPTWTDPDDPEYSIPSGESNPLGYRWMEFQGNYGIHGTNKPESIGHYVSNGCIRMNEKDVEDVFNLVKVGTPVEITYNRIVVEKTPDDQVAFYIYPDGYDRQALDVAEATKWLKGYGVQNFISDEDIEKKIAASDGEPTYIGKVYNITVNGKKLENKAVEQDGITYLPAIDLADASGVNLGWDEKAEVLISTIGKATGYDKKDNLYCNADDVQTLFPLKGGRNGKTFVFTKVKVQPKVAQPATEKTETMQTNTDATTAKTQPATK